MKLVVTVVLSLALHVYLAALANFQPDPMEDNSGSAGRAALVIGDIRFQYSSSQASPLEEKTAAPKRQAKHAERPAKEPILTAEANLTANEIEVMTDLDVSEPQRIEEQVVELEQQQPPKPLAADKLVPEQVTANTDIKAEHAGFDRIPLMEEPRYQKAFPPDYPILARKRGYQGVVMVRAKVGIDGHVQSVELKISSGYNSLDNSALNTVTQWQFHPYRVNEQVTVAWVEIPVEFTLQR